MSLRRIYILFIFINSSINIFSQPHFQQGYIVNLQGDTVKGLIDHQKWERNPKKISFKINDSSLEQIYYPINIKGFGVEYLSYISAILLLDNNSVKKKELVYLNELESRTDTVFLQLLVSGNKNLYFLKDNIKDHYFIKQDGAITELIFTRFLEYKNGINRVAEIPTYKDQLKEYFSNDLSTVSKISGLRFKKYFLVLLYEDKSSLKTKRYEQN